MEIRIGSMWKTSSGNRYKIVDKYDNSNYTIQAEGSSYTLIKIDVPNLIKEKVLFPIEMVNV